MTLKSTYKVPNHCYEVVTGGESIHSCQKQRQPLFLFHSLFATSSITHHFLCGEEVCQESKPLIEPITAPFKKAFPSLFPKRGKRLPTGNKNLRGGLGTFWLPPGKHLQLHQKKKTCEMSCLMALCDWKKQHSGWGRPREMFYLIYMHIGTCIPTSIKESIFFP